MMTMAAQSWTTGYSNTLGLGAAGGIILLLLAWTNRLRRQWRGPPQGAAVSHGPPDLPQLDMIVLEQNVAAIDCCS